MPKLRVVVVGVPGKLRSKHLSNIADSLPSTLFVAPVIFDSSIETNEFSVAEDRITELLMGGIMLDAEVGCSVAHQRALGQAAASIREDSSLDWILVCEDDADFGHCEWSSLQKLLGGLPKARPTLVSLYGTDSRCMEIPVHERPKLRRLRYLPSGTVCYLINRLALDRLSHSLKLPISYVSDWPVVFSAIDFYRIPTLVVSEATGTSTIGPRPQGYSVRKRLALTVSQLTNLSEVARLSGVAPLQALRWIISPLIRDMVALREAKFWGQRASLRRSS